MLLQSAAIGMLAVLVLEVVLVRVCSGWLIPTWWTNCYEEPPIGCFPTTYPYTNTGGIAPQGPNTINVKFYFFNPGLPRQLFDISNADQILENTYNSSAKTVLIIHGYLENGFSSWIQRLGPELLRKDSHTNVVVMNWGGGSNNLIYYQSAANARVAGAMAALLLEKLLVLGADRSSIHVIGFSLGAHVAGYVGSRVPQLGRITGLDPARLGFENVPPETRLDPSDANFVDVIHTDTSPIVGMGTLQPMGTVDFYPNRGVNQPGCPVTVMDRFSTIMSSFDFTSESIRIAMSCSHLRVISLFTASINQNCSYTISRCNTVSDVSGIGCGLCGPAACPVMGYNIDRTSVHQMAGLYLIATTGSPPFC